MEPVDSASAALEVLQRRMSANLQRLQRDGRIASTPVNAQPSTPARAQESRRALRQRLKALDGDDPRFGDRAADALVESVLLEEFGEALTNDANFRQLILQVSRDMRGDADTARQLDELFRNMRA